MRLVWGLVVEVAASRQGLQRLRVAPDGGEPGVALNYPALAGECGVGDTVLLNTTAVDLALGTGGSHFVVARVPRGGACEGVAVDDDSGGHIMKLRYTPLQRDVMAVESQESPYHDLLAGVEDLAGMPVVCCGLHSQIPLVAAAIKERIPGCRIAYCMTDEAALPLALSDLVPACRASGLLDATITCGQAFGGEYEAVTLHSALLAARCVARAHAAIVAIGPGVVGTGSAMGHGGIAQGEAINAVAALGGRPIAVLRMSFADERERHRGVSHHSLVALARIALARATVAVPVLGPQEAAVVATALSESGVTERHDCIDVPAGPPLPDTRGVPLRTMGRTPGDDPAFFASAAAGGYAAATMLEPLAPPRRRR
ncbi:MAG: DUF3866 family protein [Coriobacteriia bacterium]|nr:DUF3866 family protein [Coriobacteriia bacterium]